MDLQKYKEVKNNIVGEFLTQLKELDIEYLQANETVKVGDVIEDHIGKIQVTEINFNVPTYKYFHIKGLLVEKPHVTYVGNELKKNGEPKKITSQRTVHKSNLI